MAITYDSSWFKMPSVGTSGTSLTITLAASSVLFAFLEVLNGGAVVSAMYLNGVAMGSIAGATTANLFAWCMTSPPTGVCTWKLHLTGAFQNSCLLASYYGHSTASPPWGAVHPQSSGTANTYNISVSSTTQDLVITCIRVTGGTNPSFCNNGTTRLTATGSGLCRMILADITGAAAITLSATVQTAAASWDSVSIPLHFGVVAGGTNSHFMMLLGVG